MSGEKTKFEELAIIYEQSIYNIAYRILKDEKMAEDITQEVFIILYNKIELVEGVRDTETKHYISEITKNKAIDKYRKIVKERQHILLSDLEHLNMKKEGIATASVESEIIEKEEQQELIGKIRQLDSKYSQPIYKCFLEGKTYKNVATELLIQEETVRQRVHRGKIKLKEVLNNNEKENK